MSTCIAVPFEAWPPEKLANIVTLCQQYRPWYSDDVWLSGETYRRTLVLSRLSNPASRSWEVYREQQLVGLLHADEIVPKQDCLCHFLFFDNELRSKRQLCINTMNYLFSHYGLHILRVEIPTYAAKLVGFVRKALYFRWEAECRSFSWPSSAEPLSADAARLGSRKHHAILHSGEWCDLLLLSVTRDEFEAAIKEKVDRSQHNATSRVGTIAQPAST